MNEKHEGTAQKIYKVLMIIILTSFITFMVTSIALYTYFTKNSSFALITGDNTYIENSNLDTYLNKIKSVIEKNYLWKEKIDEQINVYIYNEENFITHILKYIGTFSEE